MTTDTPSRSEALEALRVRLVEWIEEATELLHGTGEIHMRARHGWLLHLDRALGCEDTCTVDDTIEELARADAARPAEETQLAAA